MSNKLKSDLTLAQEQNVLLRIEKAQLQVLVDGLTKIIEEFCKDEIERRSHLCWWAEDQIVSFTNQ
jgi:hypothetical protein